MKINNLDKLKASNVVVYMAFVNAWGDVVDKVELARFRNMSWAKDFVNAIPKMDTTDSTRYIVEEVQ